MFENLWDPPLPQSLKTSNCCWVTAMELCMTPSVCVAAVGVGLPEN